MLNCGACAGVDILGMLGAEPPPDEFGIFTLAIFFTFAKPTTPVAMA